MKMTKKMIQKNKVCNKYTLTRKGLRYRGERCGNLKEESEEVVKRKR